MTHCSFKRYGLFKMGTDASRFSKRGLQQAGSVIGSYSGSLVFESPVVAHYSCDAEARDPTPKP